jgi:lipoprotein-anchoring transpeptidase ErfK/SrfK
VYSAQKRTIFSGVLVLVLAMGCSANKAMVQQDQRYNYPVRGVNSSTVAAAKAPSVSSRPDSKVRVDMGLTMRTITDQEIQRISAKDPELSPSVIRHMLSRINAKAAYYIDEDIRDGRPLIVPNDLRAYKKWSPLDPYIPDVAEIPKFILIVKDEYFIGWYEAGRLVGDTHVCIGKKDGWTRAGIYTVKDKDVDHVSRSYTNAYGQPAQMPWALRIYEHVWIHAGDITEGNCSHGCINLPVFEAPKLFDWADLGTAVLIVESLDEVETVLAKNRSNCQLFARSCRSKQARLD